jgi:hypothetical protein
LKSGKLAINVNHYEQIDRKQGETVTVNGLVPDYIVSDESVPIDSVKQGLTDKNVVDIANPQDPGI